MIKDVFTLKTSSWHYRLMRWTWPNIRYYHFSHMCPYFWLTIFNVIVSPFIFLFRSTFQILELLFAMWAEWEQRQWDKWVAFTEAEIQRDPERARKELVTLSTKKWQKLRDRLIYADGPKDNEDLFKQFSYSLANARYQLKYAEKEKSPEELERIERRNKLKAEALRRQQERQEEASRRAASRQAMIIEGKRKITAILRIIKPIGKVIIYLAGGATIVGALYLLYLLILLIGRIPHKAWVIIGTGSGGVTTVGLLVVLIIIVVRKIRETYQISDWFVGLGKFFGPLGYLFISMGNGLGWFFTKLGKGFVKIGQGFEFLWDMLRGACPAVKWEVED